MYFFHLSLTPRVTTVSGLLIYTCLALGYAALMLWVHILAKSLGTMVYIKYEINVYTHKQYTDIPFLFPFLLLDGINLSLLLIKLTFPKDNIRIHLMTFDKLLHNGTS